MNQQTHWHIPILAGLALGVALGLIYTWVIAPVRYYDTAPAKLRADLKEEYILLICQAYAADGDWATTQQRLAELGDPDIAGAILGMAEEAVAQGKAVVTVRQLAAVADRLGASSPAIVLFLPTRPVIPSLTPITSLVTFTPTPTRLPPSPTVTPTPSPTPLPTFTPLPSPTPLLSYQLLARQPICDPDRLEPLIRIIVRDANGSPMRGKEIVITWTGGEPAHVFSGLKPELGDGYADFVMQPELSYTVQLAAGSQPVSGIQATLCESTAGRRLLSTRLIFEKLEP